MGQINFPYPPPIGNEDFDRYMLELHKEIMGYGPETSGTLDTDNGVWNSATTTDEITEGENNLYYTNERVDSLVVDGNALTKTYDAGAGTLILDVDKGAAVADVTVTISGTADLSYDATERDMLNAAKTDLEALKTTINELIASLEAVNHINT